MTIYVGPKEKQIIPVEVVGNNAGHYGCHAGTINSLGIGLSQLPRYGQDAYQFRPAWARVLTEPEWEDMLVWIKRNLTPYLNSSECTKLSKQVLDQFFEGVVAACSYSSYTINCVVNYNCANRAFTSCLTSMFVEYLLENKIGAMILGPTMFNSAYVSRSWNVAPSMTRACIWIKKPSELVFKDDCAVTGMDTIPTSTYHGRSWDQYLDPTIKSYNDWNKHLKKD